MDSLTFRLEAEIRERAGEGAVDELLRALDEIRAAIPRQDALRLEILIERLHGDRNGHA